MATDNKGENSLNLPLKNYLRENVRNYSMFLILIVIYLAFAVITGGVNLSGRNLTNIFIQNSYILILAVGMMVVIVTGHIDLSVGSVCAFVGAISAMLYNTGMGMVLTLLLTLLLGTVVGLWQGFWVAYMRIPSFIVTLVGMLMFRGLTYIITQVTPISLRDDGFKKIASGFLSDVFPAEGGAHKLTLLVGLVAVLGYLVYSNWIYQRNRRNEFHQIAYPFYVVQQLLIALFVSVVVLVFAFYRGIPYVVMTLAAVVGIFAFIMRKTVFGRYVYAVGGNARAAQLSGINSRQVVLLVFALMGTLSGLSGMLFAAYLNSALPQAGQLFELEAIASSFIGGASAAGGVGTIMGAIIGGLVMGVINNGMSLINLGAEYQYVVKALVLLFAVLYDITTRRNSG